MINDIHIGYYIEWGCWLSFWFGALAIIRYQNNVTNQYLRENYDLNSCARLEMGNFGGNQEESENSSVNFEIL